MPVTWFFDHAPDVTYRWNTVWLPGGIGSSLQPSQHL